MERHMLRAVSQCDPGFKMKLPRLVIESFRRSCQLKIENIKAFMAANKDFTSARLGKLQRLTTSLSEQWEHMAVAWFTHPIPDLVSDEEAEILGELSNIVGATGKAVGGVLTASQRLISGKLSETLPKPCPGLSPTIRIEGQARLGVAAEAETGALARADKVAELAADDKATFLRDAIDGEAGALVEAGGEASLEADAKTTRYFFVATFSNSACSCKVSLSMFGGPTKQPRPRSVTWTESPRMKYWYWNSSGG